MPEYLYRNPKTGKVKAVIQRMIENHVYSENGVEWERVFTTSAIGIDGKISDPFSQREFVEKTGKKRITQGEYWELSKSLSEQREKKAGRDPIRQKYYDKWSSKHGKKLHPDLQKAKVKEDALKKGIILED